MVLVRMRACAWQLSARRLMALDARGIASIDRTQSTGVDEVRRDSDDWHQPLACRPGLDRSATNQHELRRSGRGRMARRRSQGCRMIRSDPRTGLALDRSAAACLAGGQNALGS